MQPPLVGVPTPLSGPTLAIPSLPRGWSGAIAEDAWSHAQEVFPQESLGIAWPGALYERLANKASDPEHGAFSDAIDVARFAGRDAIVVHSHPGGPQCPSAADMRAQEAWGVPFVVLPLDEGGPIGPAFAWGHGEVLPYEGRPFRHGIHDCYALIRDWYAGQRGVVLDDFPRDWEWWAMTPPLDLYAQGFASQGFTEIPLAEAVQEGDLIFYAIRSAVVQHAAIVIDQHRILHHPAGLREYDLTRRSTMDLRASWMRFARMAVRRVA